VVCLCLSRSTTTKRPNGTAELQIINAWDRVQAALDRVAAVRDAVPALGIAVDFHGRVHKPMAKVLLKELEQYRLMFIEEPVLSEHLDSFLDAMINTATPIALGERLYSRWDFKSILASGDVIQEQSLGIHYNVGNDLLDYLTDRSVSTMRMASSPSPPALAWASTSTRITSENAPSWVIVGATQSGATRMDPSLNGDEPKC
jgi:hypothetical protein